MHEESESLESLSKKLQMVIENNLYEKWSNQENNLDHFQAARRMLSSILKY